MREQGNRGTEEIRNGGAGKNPPALIEAQGWTVDRDGTVHLVSDARVGIPQTPVLVPPDCRLLPRNPVSLGK